MKKLVSVTEVEGQGLEAFLGEMVLLLCANYIYHGKLTGVNETCVELTDPSIVYETGAWNEKGLKDAHRLPGKTWLVQTSFIESFGSSK